MVEREQSSFERNSRFAARVGELDGPARDVNKPIGGNHVDAAVTSEARAGVDSQDSHAPIVSGAGGLVERFFENAVSLGFLAAHELDGSVHRAIVFEDPRCFAAGVA